MRNYFAFTGLHDSHFNNTFYDLNLTRVNDDDESPAETGVKETTLKPAKYPHPTNDKIKFWDLPGIGMYHVLIEHNKVIKTK
jgi:hypothetical protein